MGMDPYIGEVMIAGFNFTPQGYVSCDGGTMTISQNSALFALLGTTFGGDGMQTFKVPDLRGRVVIGMGQGPRLNRYEIGQTGGSEPVALTIPQVTAGSTGASEVQQNRQPYLALNYCIAIYGIFPSRNG